MADIVQKVTLKRHQEKFKKKSLKENFGVGDTITVYAKVREGEKERLQAFKGVVIRIQGSGLSRSFTVRKMSAGVGVERTFPVNCPSIGEIKVETSGNVRRSKLYFLRDLKGKAARIDSQLVQAMGVDEATLAAQEAGKHPVEAEQATAQTQQAPK